MPPPEPSHPPARRSGRPEALDTFRLPSYAPLWVSNLIQFICFQVLALAMQWLVTSLTPVRSALGLVGFVQGGTIALASPPAGALVDRHPRRQLLAFARVGMALLGVGVAWLVWTDVIAYWHLLAAAVVGGLLTAVLQPAAQTLVVDVVGRDRTEQAVALNAMGTSLGTMSGGAIAGVLVAGVGMMATYLIGSAGVLLGAVLLLWVHTLPRERLTQRTSVLDDVREGFAYVRQRPPLLLAMLGCSMAFFNGAMNPMRIIFARNVLEVGAWEFGVLSATNGVGTLLCAVAVTLRPPTRRLGILIVASMLGFASGLLLYSFGFSYQWALGVELWLGITGQLWNVVAVTGFQLAVPEEMRGRVLSMVFTLAQLGFVGILGVTALADAIGDQLALGIFGAIPTVFLSLLLVFGWRTLLEMGRERV